MSTLPSEATAVWWSTKCLRDTPWPPQVGSACGQTSGNPPPPCRSPVRRSPGWRRPPWPPSSGRERWSLPGSRCRSPECWSPVCELPAHSSPGPRISGRHRRSENWKFLMRAGDSLQHCSTYWRTNCILSPVSNVPPAVSVHVQILDFSHCSHAALQGVTLRHGTAGQSKSRVGGEDCSTDLWWTNTMGSRSGRGSDWCRGGRAPHSALLTTRGHCDMTELSADMWTVNHVRPLTIYRYLTLSSHIKVTGFHVKIIFAQYSLPNVSNWQFSCGLLY